MKINEAMGKLYLVCDWIMKLAYANLLWFLFTILGIGLFGFMPASVALFTVVRKWLKKDIDIPIFQTFFQTFKKDFIKANKIGILFVLVGYVLYIDSMFIKNVTGTMQMALIVPFLIACLFYLITLLYIFPVYVHYELTVLQYIRNSFFIGILNPISTLLMIISISLLGILFGYLPEIVPFFSIVLIAIITMWGSNRTFHKMELKRKRLSDNV